MSTTHISVITSATMTQNKHHYLGPLVILPTFYRILLTQDLKKKLLPFPVFKVLLLVNKFRNVPPQLQYQCRHFLTENTYHLIGRSRGHAQHTPPSPMGPNSFVFAYIFTQKCPRRRSTPPPPPPREILDPPLHLQNFINSRFPIVYFSSRFLLVTCEKIVRW